MKKLIFLLFAFFPMLLNAQLTSENFDTFTVGSFDAQWDPANWTGWLGGTSGTNISDAQANSGANSLEVIQNNDLVALLGTLNSGTYEISFMQYIPADNGASFNFQHNYTNAAADWAAEFSFSNASDGEGDVYADGNFVPFTIIHDAWIENKIVANFNTMTAEYYYNGASILTWALNTDPGGGPGLNQLNAINFYGSCFATGGCSALAYYDDIDVVNLSVSIDNNEIEGLKTFPNPTSNQWTISVENKEIASVELFDLNGQLIRVLYPNANTVQVDVSDFANGIYVSKISTDSETAYVRFVKSR